MAKTNQLTAGSTARLQNGVNIPLVGLGTWKILPGPSTHSAITHALTAGYRHFDTA